MSSIDKVLKELVGEDFGYDRFFTNKIKVGDNWYVISVNTRSIDIASIDVVTYLKSQLIHHEHQAKQQLELIKENYLLLPKDFTLPPGTTIEDGMLCINTVYNPKTMYKEGKAYRIVTNMPKKSVVIICWLRNNITTGEMIIKPFIVTCIDGNRLIHYHSMIDGDCSPELVAETTIEFHEAVKSIKESLNIINRDSVGRLKPPDLPSVDDLEVVPLDDNNDTGGWV